MVRWSGGRALTWMDSSGFAIGLTVGSAGTVGTWSGRTVHRAHDQPSTRQFAEKKRPLPTPVLLPRQTPNSVTTSWETRMGNPISSHLIYVPNTCPDTSQSTSPTPQFSDDAASRQEEHLGEVCERCWWRWWRKRTRSSRSQQGGRCACAASEYECDKDKNRLQQEF